MKKIFTFFAAVALSVAMVNAQEVTLNFNDSTNWGIPTDYSKETKQYTDSTGTYTITLASPTDKGYKYNTFSKDNVCLLMGKKDATLTLPAFDFAVSKIEIVKANGSVSGSVTYNIYVGEDAVSEIATGCANGHSFDIAADKQAAGTVYTLKVTNSNNLQFSAINIYKVGASIEVQSIALNVSSYELAIGETAQLNVIATPAAATPVITWESDNEAVATVADGLVTAKAEGKATITAKTGELTATCEVTVLKELKGTKENPYTVEEVIALNNTKSGPYWVAGVVCGALNNSKLEAAGTKIVSNIVLGTEESYIPVELKKDTDPRAKLNIVDNADILGKEVLVYGQLVAYFSKPGVKNVTDFVIPSATAVENSEVEVKAMKVVRNGQVVIVREGVEYDLMGARM